MGVSVRHQGMARVRFYAELNDFLPPALQQHWFEYRFDIEPPLKDVIESLGIPHTEVDLILVNGESVDLAYRVRDGDTISVYPVFESLDISSIVRIRAAPLRVMRFVLDVHLGRLARYLRMLGFDTLYRNKYDDPELAQISHDEGRILLTRDRGLLMRNMVTHGYWVRSTHPMEQAGEVLRRFDLYRAARPFTRCVSCNGLLETVEKASILHRLPPQTARYYDEFSICPECKRVFWKGSHYQRMQRLIVHLLGQEPCGEPEE